MKSCVVANLEDEIARVEAYLDATPITEWVDSIALRWNNEKRVLEMEAFALKGDSSVQAIS